MRWQDWLLPLLLTGWALAVIVPGGLALSVDVSAARLQADEASGPKDTRLVVGWQNDGGIVEQDVAAIESAGDRLRTLAGIEAVTLPTRPPGWRGERTGVALAAHPLVGHSVFSGDGAVVLGLLQVVPGQDLAALAVSVERAAAVDGMAVHVTGPALLELARTDVIAQGLKRLLIAGGAGFVVLLLLLWRSLRAVSAIVLAVGASLLWTLAAQQSLSIPLDMVTLIAPTLTATLTLAYAMHLLASASETKWLSDAIAAVRQPVMLTAATTAVGLLALLLSPAPAIRDFALLAAIGTGFAAVASLTVLPLVLRTRSRRPHWRHWWPALMQPILSIASALAKQGSWPVMLTWTLAILLLGWGAMRVSHELDPLRGLPPENETRQTFETLNRATGGLQTLQIELRLAHSQAWIQPEAHQALIALEQDLERHPEIASVLTHLDHARSARLWFDEDPTQLPAGPALAQLLVFGSSDHVYETIDRRFQIVRYQLRTSVTGSREATRLFERIESALAEARIALPEVETRVTGELERLHETSKALAESQRQSLLIALAAMWLLLTVLFASPRTGLLLLLPNTVPLVAFFGLIGWTGLSLGPVTGLAACVVLGIAVDDTLHYFARYHALARRRAEEQQAAIEALERTALPITMTTLALVVGFVSLTTTALEEHLQFGLLCAVALLVAWCCDLFLTPQLAARMRFVTLWDSLRLNLGPSPEDQIPLLSGLSKRQARSFALLTELQDRPAGDLIMHAGERNDACFVVVEGELRVHRDSQQQPRHVATLRRGALVGEVGLFSHARTANVVAKTGVRLIRFSRSDLRHLVVREPRIAAVVLFNLNEIQAERRSQDSRPYVEAQQSAGEGRKAETGAKIEELR